MTQPLEGIRIADLTHDWAGPHATRLLADYGAEVVKIEYRRRLDGMRGAYLENIDAHPRWWEINRNKQSITLDLHEPEQVAAFEKLVAVSDVVVENSRPGVMDSWGLGWERLREIKPDLVMVSMSAYGVGGPESHYAGYGGAIEALSGVQGLTAYGPGEDAMRVRELDVTNGLMGACAIMTALAHRQRTGEGQWVDLSECETSTWMAGDHLLARALGLPQTLPIGNRHPRFAPQGCYPCQGEDRWVVLTIRSDAEWRALCDCLGREDWASDPRFGDAQGRRDHHDEIDAGIAAFTRDRERLAVADALQAAGLAAGPVLDARDVAEDAHLAARDWLLSDGGDGRYPGLPFRFARGGGRFARRGPDLGEDNAAVLCDLLGLPRSLLEAVEAAPLGTAFDLE